MSKFIVAPDWDKASGHNPIELLSSADYAAGVQGGKTYLALFKALQSMPYEIRLAIAEALQKAENGEDT